MPMVVMVAGAGTMGCGIAQVFAQHGFDVVLYDVSKTALDQARNQIERHLIRLVEKNQIDQTQYTETTERLAYIFNLKEACPMADLMIEAISEKEDIKLDFFKEVDRLCAPDCIVASNTSAISIEKLALNTARKERVLGLHFMNPVPLMRLVEVVQTQYLDPKVLHRMMHLCTSIGKEPILVNNSPGFVSNRILMPMINEAILTLEEGVASVQAIDSIMHLGMAHPMGPLQLADLIGLDVCFHILTVLQTDLASDKYKPADLLKTMVRNKTLGRKTGQGFYRWEQGKIVESK